jgi:hypothetical protein
MSIGDKIFHQRGTKHNFSCASVPLFVTLCFAVPHMHVIDEPNGSTGDVMDHHHINGILDYL